MLYIVLRCILLHWVALLRIDLLCIVLRCIALHCVALLRIDLLCIVLRCFVLIAMPCHLPGVNLDGKQLQKSDGVEIDFCFTHGETTDLCTSLSLGLYIVLLCFCPATIVVWYVCIYTLVCCPVVVSTPGLVGVCVCVSSTAGTDSDRVFSIMLASGTFAADRSLSQRIGSKP